MINPITAQTRGWLVHGKSGVIQFKYFCIHNHSNTEYSLINFTGKGKRSTNISIQSLSHVNILLKGIVTDSNNIFLWHESEDINKKSFFPKFQLIPSSNFQVMHDYVCFIAPIDYCVK